MVVLQVSSKSSATRNILSLASGRILDAQLVIYQMDVRNVKYLVMKSVSLELGSTLFVSKLEKNWVEYDLHRDKDGSF